MKFNSSIAKGGNQVAQSYVDKLVNEKLDLWSSD